MHQALETVEILDAIFSYLQRSLPEGQYDNHWDDFYLPKYGTPFPLHQDMDIESKKCTRDLLSSALSCRHFSSLALRYIWRNQRGIQNVLKLLPGYNFQKREDTIEIIGTLKEEHWERFDIYAKFVRRIVISRTTRPEIHRSTYRQIQTSRKSRVLFPNLREIYCEGIWDEVYLLLSPSLRRVVLREGGYLGVPHSVPHSRKDVGRYLGSSQFLNAVLQVEGYQDTPHPLRDSPPTFFSNTVSFIEKLPSICPDLQSLEAYIVLPSILFYSLSKLRKLQYLGWDFEAPQSRSGEYMAGILLLPNLRKLRLGANPSSKWLQSLPMFSFPESFSALEQVDFYGSLESIANCEWLPSFILPSVTAISAEIEFERLDTLGFEYDYQPHKRSAKQLCYNLCETLAKHGRSSASCLSSLSFSGKSSSHSFLPATMHVDAFHPLLELRRLETLVFDIALVGFGDQTLIKWAKAWSNLKSFKVAHSNGSREGWMPFDAGASIITLRGVTTLLQLCPDLKNLALAFNASEFDMIQIPGISMPPLEHRLENWDLKGSTVTQTTLQLVLDALTWALYNIHDVTALPFQGGEAKETLPHCLKRLAY
ncbi:hypothetical protein M413DRAFT_30135 [Hebeloma cylindrosporum]|uniref:F-box domain-containing protein n=1 Tax=Hebeloma cylindrosporum TaxID=76867 RepID=A0A0C2YCB3_HEBCY|nr:hypothetical protein M413DRAFT_30135 [Hebeloma cylindrosporum h7]